MRKKIPPYGKALADLISEGYRPELPVFLFTGENAWKEAKNHYICSPETTLLFPQKDHPFDYLWPVTSCQVVIINTSPMILEVLETLILALLEYGAGIVAASHICPNNFDTLKSEIIIYKRN